VGAVLGQSPALATWKLDTHDDESCPPRVFVGAEPGHSAYYPTPLRKRWNCGVLQGAIGCEHALATRRSGDHSTTGRLGGRPFLLPATRGRTLAGAPSPIPQPMNQSINTRGLVLFRRKSDNHPAT
jgi:hypothetical protein